jgi:hypothetical protein
MDSTSFRGWYSHCIPFVMTLFYFNTMFLFIMFLVYSSSIFDIVMIDNKFMHKITKCLIQYSSELSGQHYVNMVLRYCFPMGALYIPSHVVDPESDTPMESFVLHSLYVEQVEPGCEGSLAMFLIFLSNVPYA